MSKKVRVAIVGAGTAGLNAMGQVRRVTDDFVLINGGELGTTCARVGCMPSKAAIQVADDYHRRKLFSREGIEGDEGLSVDIPESFEHVRDIRDILVDRVLSHSTDEMGDEFIEGYASFTAPGVLEVEGETIEADNIILACGTSPVVPEGWQTFGDRILTTDSLFEQEEWPESMAVIGLGVIGLELGQALSRMGITVTGFDLAETIGGITDPAISQAMVELIGREFSLHLGADVEISEEGEALKVSAGEHSVVVEQVLVAMGRSSNLKVMNLEKADIPLTPDGLPDYHPNTMQCGKTRVFVAGDSSGHRQILHEASDEGRIAGYNATREESLMFARKVPLTIAFTDPNICMVGAMPTQLESEEYVVGEMRMGPVGRALIMGKNRGMLRVYVRKIDARIMGATLVMTKGENVAQLIAWAIEQNMTAMDVLAMPFYHPTMEEAFQGAVRAALAQLPELTSEQDYPADIRPLQALIPDQ